MVSISSFKKTLALSAAGHVVVFSLFSISFGRSYPKSEHAAIAFWGQCLSSSQTSVTRPETVLGEQVAAPIQIRQRAFIDALEKPQARAFLPPLSSRQQKPEYSLNAVSSKQAYGRPPQYPVMTKRTGEADLVLHPVLPYDLSLYFQDRELAHVELEFKIVSAGMRNSVMIRRRISSGNLDADLVCMRHISHYLSRQQGQFSRDTWHTVRIDLSADPDPQL